MAAEYVTTRACRKCGGVKLLEEFETHSQCRYGRTWRCLACALLAKSAWAEKNGIKDKRRSYFYNYNKSKIAHERKKKWKKENPEKNAAVNRAWRQRNPGLQIRYASNYAKRYPHKVNAANAKRRAAELRATPAWANLDLVRDFYRRAERMTKETGIRYHVDHVIPLRGKSVCGLHVETNLQILTINQNSRKRNSFCEEYLSDFLGVREQNIAA